MDLWIFILHFMLSSNTTLFLKLLQSVPLGALSVSACVSLTYPTSVQFFGFGFLFCLVWALLHFLALQDAAGSSCIPPAPVLEWTISPRSPGLFYWRTGGKNQGLRAKCAHCYWDVIASRLSQLLEKRNMCIRSSTYTQVYKYINIYNMYIN